MNLIGNTCVPSWITTKCLNQALCNPFTWCIMDFKSSYNLVKYFEKINWLNFDLKVDDEFHISLIVDNKVKIQYVHYHLDFTATTLRKKVNDIYYNKIHEFIVEKYLARTKRMISNGDAPIFIFASANERKVDAKTNAVIEFSPEEQKALYDINSPYKIFMSYKTLYKHPNAIPQTERFTDNGVPFATYVYNKIYDRLQ